MILVNLLKIFLASPLKQSGIQQGSLLFIEKSTMVDKENIFEAVRRGYNEFQDASNAEIIDYFSSVDPDSILGHHSNIKGIFFELEYQDLLASQGIESELFEITNYPAVDIMVWGEDGMEDLQLKATDSVSYINTTFDIYPDVPIVATSEVAAKFDTEMVMDSGIQLTDIDNAVTETLFEESVNPISPLSIVGWFFGLF